MRACGHARGVAAVTVMSCWASGPGFLRGGFGGTSDTGRYTAPAGFVPTKVGAYQSRAIADQGRPPPKQVALQWLRRERQRGDHAALATGAHADLPAIKIAQAADDRQADATAL